MALATAALDARTARRVTAAAIAAALQGVFYWLILHEAVEPTAPPAATPLEVTLLQTVRRLKPTTLTRKRRALRRPAARRQEAAPPAAKIHPVTLPRAANPPRFPAIDWSGAMQREVRAEESQAPARKLRFGFPQQPARAAAVPEFGWDYASTHRLQALPQGGMLINLNDRCGLVFYGFLFPFCRIGRIPVNGHLFDHMRDRRAGEPRR